MDVGENLSVEAKQNKSTSESRSFGFDTTGAIHYSESESDRQKVDDHSNIIGEKSVHITVGIPEASKALRSM